MGRALIVSAGTSANEYLCARLGELGYARPLILPSGAEARRRMAETEFELILVNAPLPDEFGHELCVDAAAGTDAGVILLMKAAAAEQMEAALTEQGVMVLAKPFSNALFIQTVRIAAAGNRRMQRLRADYRRLQDKLSQLRLVSRAKVCLITQRGMTEDEAHRYIEKLAMDSRRSRGEVAQEVLDSFDPDSV